MVRHRPSVDPTGPSAEIDPGRHLLVAARADPAAFGQFFEEQFDDVLAFFVRRTACGHTAADLAAETFAQALAGLARYDPALGSDRSWLFGIATNQFRQWLRRGRVEAKYRTKLGILTPQLEQPELERIEALVDCEAKQPELRGALDALSPIVRSAIELRVMQGLPYAEVAERLQCTEVNARVRVARGIERLTLVLEADG